MILLYKIAYALRLRAKILEIDYLDSLVSCGVRVLNACHVLFLPSQIVRLAVLLPLKCTP